MASELDKVAKRVECLEEQWSKVEFIKVDLAALNGYRVLVLPDEQLGGWPPPITPSPYED